jgi:PHP family Zn ribbon phosphoesterase
MSSGILSFTACRRCVTANRRYKLHVGLIGPTMLRVWCATCDTKVFDFELANAMPIRCDACGEQVTEGHKH